VVYPRNRYLSAKVRAFIDFIVSIDPAREAELRLSGTGQLEKSSAKSG
jgi:hypothetical protein